MSEAAKAVPADDALIDRFRAGWFGERDTSSYHLTRLVVLRWIGAIYLVAFLVALFQVRGLIGQHGILPAAWFLSDVREHELEVPDMYGRPWAHIWEKYWEEGMQRPQEEDVFSFE